MKAISVAFSFSMEKNLRIVYLSVHCQGRQSTDIFGILLPVLLRLNIYNQVKYIKFVWTSS